MIKEFRFKKEFEFKNVEYICTRAQKYYQRIIDCVKNNLFDQIDCVIVFGSSLGIEFTRYSDLDIVLIVPNHDFDSFIKKTLVRAMFEVETDIIIFTHEEYMTLEQTSPIFYTELKERSKIIYER